MCEKRSVLHKLIPNNSSYLQIGFLINRICNVSFRDFVKKADTYSDKISLVHVMILSCLFALISILYTQGGILYGEMYIRLPFYMSDMPLLNKLFDSRILDDRCYRARELSYFFDVIDFQFVKFSIEKGIPHFLSLTHYVLSILTGCVLWLFCVKELNLRPLLGIGWLALFWTSPSIFFSALNRTGKIWVTFLTAILFYLIYRITAASRQEFNVRISPNHLIAFSLIIITMTFLDEQGIFLTFAALIVLALWNFFVRNKAITLMLLTGSAVLLFHGLYRYVVAPRLTHAINGYRPDFTFQEIPFSSFIQNLGTYLLSGLSSYIDSFRFLTGSPPSWIAYGLLFIILLFSVRLVRSTQNVPSNDKKFSILILVEVLTVSLLLPILMHSLMVLKSPNLVLPEFRRIYYWSPTVIFLAMTLAFLTHVVCKSHVPKWMVGLLMGVAILGNIIALPGHKSIILNQGYFAPYVQPSRVLSHALKDMPRSQTAHDPLITKNPIFKYFTKEKNKHHDGADMYNDRGLFHSYLGLHRLAVEDFHMAIGLKQDYLNAHDRVIPYRELNRHWQTTEADENAELLKQDYAEAYNNRGIDAANQGKKELALTSFSEAITLKKNFAFAYSNRGVMFFALGHNERGCRDANRACLSGHCELFKAAQSRRLCR